MKETIAFFDFDGTITSKDSFLEFIRFVHGDVKFFFGFLILSPILVAYKLKIIPNFIAKEKVITYFFKDTKKDIFQEVARNYSLSSINNIVKKSAMEKIKWHKLQNHKVVVVSASIDDWLRPWCIKNDIELIATKLESSNGIMTGRLSSKNCYGQEKVDRIKSLYNLDIFSDIYVYGDSRGDKEMLSIASRSYYKYFA